MLNLPILFRFIELHFFHFEYHLLLMAQTFVLVLLGQHFKIIFLRIRLVRIRMHSHRLRFLPKRNWTRYFRLVAMVSLIIGKLAFRLITVSRIVISSECVGCLGRFMRVLSETLQSIVRIERLVIALIVDFRLEHFLQENVHFAHAIMLRVHRHASKQSLRR